MNRRDILSSLSAWATAASVTAAASEPTSVPTTVEGWPRKPLPEDHPLRRVFSDDDRAMERIRRRCEKTTALPMDVEVHDVPPEKTLLVFRMTMSVSQEMVDSVCSNIRSWVKNSGIDCAAILLPYGLELEVHRIPAGASPSGVSVSPKE